MFENGQKKNYLQKHRNRMKPLITSCFYDSFLNFFISFSFFLFISVSEAFIVPQEIPSLLSLVYSNIPPIKKGNSNTFFLFPFFLVDTVAAI